jgi:hypothetical protein
VIERPSTDEDNPQRTAPAIGIRSLAAHRRAIDRCHAPAILDWDNVAAAWILLSEELVDPFV